MDEVKFLKNLLFHFYDFKKLSYFPYLWEVWEKEVIRVCIFSLKEFDLAYEKLPSNANEFLVFIEKLIEDKKIVFSNEELVKPILQRLVFQVWDFNSEKDIVSFQIFEEAVQKKVKQYLWAKYLSKGIEYFRQGNLEEIKNLFLELIEKERLSDKFVYTLDDFLSEDKVIRGYVCPTGFEYLDYYMEGGIALGELGLISSPPGFGKTTLLLNILVNGLLSKKDFQFIYVSLELLPQEIYNRLFSILFDLELKIFENKAPKDYVSFLKTIFSEEEVNYYLELLRNNLKVLYFKPFTEVNDILFKIKELKEKDLVVFVDYLNEIEEKKAKDLFLKYETIMTKFDEFSQNNQVAFWIATQAHLKGKSKEKVFDMKDLYGSKVGISKKLSFGLGIVYDESKKLPKINFFKNRLKGKISDSVYIYRKSNSLKIYMEEKVWEFDKEIVKKEVTTFSFENFSI